MAGRWSNRSAFRADPAATPAARPSRQQTAALVAVLALVIAAAAVASYVVRPEHARTFDLFHGSVFLADQRSPVAVDLATGKPTLRLLGADKQVGVTGSQSLAVVPLQNRTLLLNQDTGEFNMVDSGGFVVKHEGGGVPLTPRAGRSSSMGVASDDGQAYIVRTGPRGGTDVYLVSQPTVEAAINATGSVRPRASTSMREVASVAPGASVGADGDLWLLVGAGAGSARTIRQLSVPPGSSAGAVLAASDHGGISGPAALGAASLGADGSGTTVVGVASPDSIQLFGPGTETRTETFTAPPAVDTVLSTTDGAGRLAYLLHGSTGWSVVSIAADGTGLRAPKAITAIPPTARLAEPAASNGALYTLDRTTGRIYRIDYDAGAAAVSSYPLSRVGGRVVEPTDFADAYLISRGPRVVINSAVHADALVLFTDGSHPPTRVAKSAAVTVNAAAGARALTGTTGSPSAPGKTGEGRPAKPKPQAAAPVNTRIDCRTVSQKPHIPVITSALPGSRSVALSWSYPLLDSQDCYPSTYVVNVQLLSDDAPQPPSEVRVQSQTGTNLTGLFPSTDYRITLTAFINGQGTASAPIRISTGKEGPAAPTGVTARADATGNWIVDFEACGSVTQGCVAAQSWTITPSFCDGLGVSAPPKPLVETADPTARRQPTAVYAGSDDLLGRGLRFQVQGTGDGGEAGAVSATTPCVRSWAPPQPGGVRLAASTPDGIALGATTSTAVTLDLGSDPVRAVGGIGAGVQFRLTGPGGTTAKSLTYTGRSAELTTSFDGIRAGAQYSVSATISPPGHAGSAVTLPPQPVVTAAQWPAALSISADCPSNLLGCDLAVSFHGLSSALAGDERFSLGSDSDIVCADTSRGLVLNHFDPGSDEVTASLSQLDQFYGTCTVHLWLLEDGNPPFVFGGVRSPELTTSVELGAPVSAGAGQDDFTVRWSDVNGVSAEITYTGSADLGQLTQGWSETITAPGAQADCGEPDGAATPDPTVEVTLSTDCIDRYSGFAGQWQIAVTYHDRSDNTQHGPFTYLLGDPPGSTNRTCAPTAFAASWGTSAADGIHVAYAGSPDTIAGCHAWSYAIFDVAGAQVCGASSDSVSGAPPVSINLAQCGTPPAAGWTLKISWQDATNQSASATTAVTGDPPTS